MQEEKFPSDAALGNTWGERERESGVGREGGRTEEREREKLSKKKYRRGVIE